MHRREIAFACVCAWFVSVGPNSLQAGDSSRSTERLQQTQAVNLEAIIEAQLPSGAAPGFRVADPYSPEASKAIELWHSNPANHAVVCALRFTNSEQFRYELREFESSTAASEAGYVVTHHGRCGSCSSLADLAVYLRKPDLTTPARQCARRFGLERKKTCFEESVGFTPWCAESWAYNADNTRRECLTTCIADYGFFNLLFNRSPGQNVDDSGRLRPCLQCDEDESGDGFKFSAGRTRRNSGIESAIPRPESEVYPVDHSAYFQ